MDRILLHLPATGQTITVATERGARNAEGRGWVRGPVEDTPEPDDDEPDFHSGGVITEQPAEFDAH